ncbi:MAG TPA: DUF4271 domain-containing protein [Bacteroidia bacterium]|nr:DUF4271 domain-containing protein [Bacteroidia bacterium]
MVSVFRALLPFSVNPNGFTHIFSEHILKPHHQGAIPLLRNSDPLWMSLYLVAGISLLVLIRHAYLRDFFSLANWFSGQQSQRKLSRDESGQFRFYPVLMNLFFVMNLAYLAYQVNTNFHLILKGSAFILQFLFFFVCILALIFYKWIINRILATVSNEPKLVSEYDLITASSNQLTGLILFPLIVLNTFSNLLPQFVFLTSLSVLGFMLLFKWGKGFVLGALEERIGILQILTYFCALEILPQLMAVKFIIETF